MANPAAKASQAHWTGQITVSYHESGSGGANGTTGGDVRAVYLVQRDAIADLSQWVAYHSAQALGYCGSAQRVVSGLGAQHVTTNAGSIGVAWSDRSTFALTVPSVPATSTQHIQLVRNNRKCSPIKATDKDSFTVPLPDLSALRGNAKLPDISGSTSRTCTGCALQLGKPGFAATGNWTTTVTWDLVAASALGASRKKSIRHYATGLRTQCAELTVLSATLAGGTRAAPALAPTIATLAAECLYDATQALAVVNDPADPHYKRIATASAPPIAPVVANGLLSSSAAASLTAYMRSWARAIGAENALVLSLNRMTGARNAKSTKYVRAQLKAARRFALQLAAAMQKRERAAGAALSTLHAARIQGLVADPADLDAVRLQALTGTLPERLTDAFTALNVPAAVPSNAQMALALFSTSRLKTLSGFPELLTDPTMLALTDRAAAQLRHFGRPPKPRHHRRHKP